MTQADVFYSTACNECKRVFSTELPARRCSGCKMVCYCCRGHQRTNWSKHKDLCQRIQSVLKETGKAVIFQAVESSKDWWQVRTKAMYLVEKSGTSRLLAHQRQMFLFPEACQVCYATYPTHLEPCCGCHTVSYCSDSHRLADLPSHGSVCPSLKLCMDVDIYMVNTSFDVTDLPRISLATQAKQAENMDEFVTAYFPEVNDKTNTILSSEMVTCIATLLYALQKASRQFTKDRMTLHILGPKQLEYSLFPTLEVLFHRYICLKNLDIVFVGPECPSYPSHIALCPHCISSKTVSVDVHSSTTYHEYLSNRDVDAPDLIVAYNCGLHEFEGQVSDTWMDSIPLFMNYPETLIILTSYNKWEAAKDLKRVLSIEQPRNTPRLIVECEENPFRSLRPYRDWEQGTGSVFYQNNFISVLETCSPI